MSLCRLLGVELTVIPTDILSIDGIAANPPDRCYICKSAMLGAIKNRADADGYAVIIDGTNASDDVSDRPGMRAVRELGILSPLRICGMTKPEIRKRLRGAGLNEWDKPSYSCLATRLSQGTEITPDRLKRIEISENILRGMGLSDFRLRTDGDTARLQVKAEQAQTASELLSEIRQSLSHYYREIQLDEKYR